MPFLQHSITSFGQEIKNIGAATTGIDKSLKNVERAFCFGESGKEFSKYLVKKKIKSIYFNKLENVFLSAVKKALEKKLLIFQN